MAAQRNKSIRTQAQLIDALDTLLAYCWADEERDYTQHNGPRSRHIFTTMKALNGWARRARRTGDIGQAIARMLDGTEWTVDTLDEIADVLRAAGYQVRDVADVASEDDEVPA